VHEAEIARRAYRKWEARSQNRDGHLKDWLEAEFELANEAAITGELVEANQRLTHLLAQRQDAERRLLAEHAVGRILAGSDTLAAAAPKLVQAIGESLDWDMGVVWLLDRDDDLLRCVEVWNGPHVEIPALKQEILRQTFRSGIGLPGCVWAGESVVWIPDVTADTNFPQGRSAAREGLRGAVGFPVRNGAEFLGILEFFSRNVRQPDVLVTEMMASIAGCPGHGDDGIDRPADQPVHRTAGGREAVADAGARLPQGERNPARPPAEGHAPAVRVGDQWQVGRAECRGR
jgi:hypothetical protein